jgi:hypothetical protein
MYTQGRADGFQAAPRVANHRQLDIRRKIRRIPARR